MRSCKLIILSSFIFLTCHSVAFAEIGQASNQAAKELVGYGESLVIEGALPSTKIPVSVDSDVIYVPDYLLTNSPRPEICNFDKEDYARIGGSEIPTYIAAKVIDTKNYQLVVPKKAMRKKCPYSLNTLYFFVNGMFVKNKIIPLVSIRIIGGKSEYAIALPLTNTFVCPFESPYDICDLNDGLSTVNFFIDLMTKKIQIDIKSESEIPKNESSDSGPGPEQNFEPQGL